jgi:hypothetical protein
LKGIENELKLKYEIEQLEQEINDLKNENREGLEITLEASRN